MGRSKKERTTDMTSAVRPASKRWLIMAVFLVAVGLLLGVLFVLDRLIDPGLSAAEIQRLQGRWLRTNGDYILEIRKVSPDGHAEASYLNPRGPVNVAQARVHREEGSVRVFIELQDVGYPGSTYTLTYDAQRDQLRGTYFLAADREQFDVTFVREQ
jgi:hypothetical protein